MRRTPKAGEKFQLCTHLASDDERPDRHWWEVPDFDPWIVLCDACHASYSHEGSVVMRNATFELTEDIPIVAGSSMSDHALPETIASAFPRDYSSDGAMCVCDHPQAQHTLQGGVLACTVDGCACGPGCIHDGFVGKDSGRSN